MTRPAKEAGWFSGGNRLGSGCRTVDEKVGVDGRVSKIEERPASGINEGTFGRITYSQPHPQAVILQQFQMWIKEYFFPMAEKIIPLCSASR
jgi:hypothetical protein